MVLLLEMVTVPPPERDRPPVPVSTLLTFRSPTANRDPILLPKSMVPPVRLAAGVPDSTKMNPEVRVNLLLTVSAPPGAKASELIVLLSAGSPVVQSTAAMRTLAVVGVLIGAAFWMMCWALV